MNFDKDYEEFVEHLEKHCVVRPVELKNRDKVALESFVTYLNIRYKKGLMVLR